MLEVDEATAAPTTEVWPLWHQEPLAGHTHCLREVVQHQCPAAPHLLKVAVTGKDRAQVRTPNQDPHLGFPVAQTNPPAAATDKDEATFQPKGHSELERRYSAFQAELHSALQAYLHSVHEFVASLFRAMPRSRSACPLCGLDTKSFWLSLKDHVRTKHLGRRPLHRTYNLSSSRRLQSFLAFLAYEIQNVRSHPHFEELSQWATNNSIFWKGDGGQMIEKLVHLVINTHVAPCTREKCMIFKLRVNFTGDWSAYTTESCHKCHSKNQAGNREVVTWHLEDFVTWVPWPYSPSLSAELITLVLNPDVGWRPQPSQNALGNPIRQPLPRGWRPPLPVACSTCGKQQLERQTYATGGPFYIMVAALYADICTCGFECVWGL